jgi:hypothetical protein
VQTCRRWANAAVAIVGIVCTDSAFAQAVRAPHRVSRLGDYRDYGSGIVGASLQQLRFELGHGGYVIVLRVHPDGGVEPLHLEAVPTPPDSEAVSRTVVAPDVAMARDGGERELDPVLSRQTLERAGRRVRPPAAGREEDEPSAAAYWWLLVVSDVPTTVDELATALAAFANRTFSSVQAEVRALPRDLVGTRARRWAAYFTAVEP